MTEPRPAEFDDIPRLTSYISAFHKASPYSDVEFSPGATRTVLQDLIVRPTACVFIHDHGALGGEISRLRFGRACVAQELFWWAEKDGLALLKAFEDWAQDNGGDLICMAALADQRFERFYARKGYQSKETFYVRQV